MMKLVFLAGAIVAGGFYMQDANVSQAVLTLSVAGGFVGLVIYALMRDA